MSSVGRSKGSIMLTVHLNHSPILNKGSPVTFVGPRVGGRGRDSIGPKPWHLTYHTKLSLLLQMTVTWSRGDILGPGLLTSL